MHAALLALALAAPLRYLKHRTPFMAAVRFMDVLILPLMVDWTRIHQRGGRGRQAAGAAAAGAAAGAAEGPGWRAAPQRWRALAGARVQSAVLLVVAAAKLQSVVGAAVAVPLPPVLHLALHTATVAALCLNTPKGAHGAGLAGAPLSLQSAVHCLARWRCAALCRLTSLSSA